jgi:Ribonuclease R winged-helix domain
MEDSGAQLPHGERPRDLDSGILDLLRKKDAQSAQLLAETLSHEDEQVGADAVRSCLVELASRGLVRSSTEATRVEESVAKADRWELTEEGRAVAEPPSGAVQAPRDRAIDGEDDGHDAGFWVLVVIAVVTAVCAAYTLLTVSGVLGGG